MHSQMQLTAAKVANADFTSLYASPTDALIYFGRKFYASCME